MTIMLKFNNFMEDTKMSNPQIEALKTANNLQAVQDCIKRILVEYASDNMPLCSHEILGLIDYKALKAIAESIKPDSGGYSVPSSWIGSVAADMANAGIIMQTEKHCIYNHKQDAAWYI
jgi:hypothetical protein